MASVGDLWAKLPRRAVDAARARGDKRFVARWRDATGKSKEKRFHTRAEALAHATAHDHRGGAVGELTVTEVVRQYVHSKRHLKSAGLESVKLHAGHVTDALGDIAVAALRRSMVEDWVAAMSCADSSKRKRLALLRAALVAARQTDVTAGIVVSIKDKTPMAFLTMAELVTVARTARTVTPSKHGPRGERVNAEMWETLILLLGTAGMRVTEALTLTVGQHDYARSLLWVEGTKTVTSRRWVVLPHAINERLHSYIGDRVSDELIFQTSRGTAVTRERVGERVRDASLRGIGRRIRVHDLRHTAASALIEAGGLVVAAKQLGHADAGITAAVYGHVRDSAVRESVDAVSIELNRALGVKSVAPTTGEVTDADAAF